MQHLLPGPTNDVELQLAYQWKVDDGLEEYLDKSIVNTYGNGKVQEKYMIENQSEQNTDIEQKNGTKVARVIREYELDDIGEEIENRWLGDDGERQSLRNLADDFNREVLEAALERAGEQPIDGEIENFYRLLTSNDISASARTEAETRLERIGIKVVSLRRDFVSHQAIHTYLTDVREASLPDDEPSADDAIHKRKNTILRLRNRLVAVTERSIESLRKAGYLSIGTFDAMVTVSIYCDDCGASYDLADLLRRRACDCVEEAD